MTDFCTGFGEWLGCCRHERVDLCDRCRQARDEYARESRIAKFYKSGKRYTLSSKGLESLKANGRRVAASNKAKREGVKS